MYNSLSSALGAVTTNNYYSARPCKSDRDGIVVFYSKEHIVKYFTEKINLLCKEKYASIYEAEYNQTIKDYDNCLLQYIKYGSVSYLERRISDSNQINYKTEIAKEVKQTNKKINKKLLLL